MLSLRVPAFEKLRTVLLAACALLPCLQSCAVPVANRSERSRPEAVVARVASLPESLPGALHAGGGVTDLGEDSLDRLRWGLKQLRREAQPHPGSREQAAPSLRAAWRTPSGAARLASQLRAARSTPELQQLLNPDLSRARRAARDVLEEAGSPEGWTPVGGGISFWVEMVRPAEEIVQEALELEHDIVREPTLWSLAWAVEVDARTSVFASISASRRLDEAVTDSMFDPDYAWFGLGVLFHF